MFLEKCFGVTEPQIGKHRRAVCGDLTTAFNFQRPNDEPLPTLAGRKSKAEADALTAAQQALPAIVPPADAALPAQATGVRPSRALPYELHTSARSDSLNGRVQLLFANSGRAAAVFHVYDKLHLSDSLPRRYVVEPGKQLDGHWAAMTDNAGLYDLWVLGPNGFHRQFKGDLNRLRAGGAAAPEIRVGYDTRRGDIVLEMRNDGHGDCRFTVQSNKAYPRPDAYQAGGRGRHEDRPGGNNDDDNNNGVYGTHPDGSWRIRVRGGGDTAMRWSLDASGQWYDFVVTCDADASFYRRFAGRIETGRHSVSDPAMGLPDRF
jgi:phospholipase C